MLDIGFDNTTIQTSRAQRSSSTPAERTSTLDLGMATSKVDVDTVGSLHQLPSQYIE